MSTPNADSVRPCRVCADIVPPAAGVCNSVVRRFVVELTCPATANPIDIADYLLDYLCDNDGGDEFYDSCDSVDPAQIDRSED